MFEHSSRTHGEIRVKKLKNPSLVTQHITMHKKKRRFCSWAGRWLDLAQLFVVSLRPTGRNTQRRVRPSLTRTLGPSSSCASFSGWQELSSVVQRASSKLAASDQSISCEVTQDRDIHSAQTKHTKSCCRFCAFPHCDTHSHTLTPSWNTLSSSSSQIILIPSSSSSFGTSLSVAQFIAQIRYRVRSDPNSRLLHLDDFHRPCFFLHRITPLTTRLLLPCSLNTLAWP